MTTTERPPATRSGDYTSAIDGLAPRWVDRERLGYLPGLDGIRALSALAVLAYHLDFGWAAGGYLGVEVFFVVSGFLITRLMLDEERRTSALDRARFWGRRARRLLPAILAVILGCVAWSTWVGPEGDLATYRGDVYASLFYVQNWHAIFADQPYFEAFGRPSPLRHIWSLSIEEQFYLLWPLALPFLLRRFGRRWSVAFVLVAAGLSALLMNATADVTAPERAYYGTDTRAFGILLGCALAFWWRPERMRTTVAAPARAVIDVVGIVALAALGWQFMHRSEFDPWTYPQGFLFVDACTILVLVAATHPAAGLRRYLGAPKIAWLGRRSYSLYLWHWPVIAFTRPGVDWGLEGWQALGGRLVLIAALTEFSYRCIEQPFRDGRMHRVAGAISGRIGVIPARRLAVSSAGVALVALLVFVAAAAPAPAVETASTPPQTITTAAPTTTTTTTTTAPTTTTTAAPVDAPTTTAPTTTVAPTTAPPPQDAPPEVTVVGESVTLGAAPSLQNHWGSRVQIDAVESRQADESIDRIEQLAAEGSLTDVLVVHIGNNGVIPSGGFDRVLAAAGDRTVVVVTVRVPRRWEQPVNDEVRSVAEAHDNVQLADWNQIAGAEEGLLVDDGVHLTTLGQQRYTEMLVGFRP